MQPAVQGLATLMRRPPPDITARAVDRWVEAPGGEVNVRPAVCLPDQLGRIRGAMFGTIGEVVRDFRGGFVSPQPPTLGYRIRHVDLVDGVLRAGGTARHLRPRRARTLTYRRPAESVSGALYETWGGNRWFGMWLGEDCLTYPLAERHGPAVTTAPATGHVARYEALLGLNARRVGDVHFDELILFDDSGDNRGKRRRADDLRRRLAPAGAERHPGVFLLRGTSGERRILRNERALAEGLAARRGFRMLDPSTSSVDRIVADCAGAAVIAGVEGSHLVHGVMTMPLDARLFVIQPPMRAVSRLKLATDRQGQDYAFVVGTGDDDGFTVDAEEVERTLDLA